MCAMRTPHINAAAVAIATTVVVWASAFAGIRAALAGYAPGPLALFRFTTASLLLGLYALYVRMPLPPLRDWPGLALIGLVGIVLYQLALGYGEKSVTAGVAAVIVATAPIVTALLAAAFLRELPPAHVWVGLLLAFIGVARASIAPGERLGHGAFIVALAALAQGTFFVLQKRYVARYSALAVTTVSIWLATLMLAIPFGGDLVRTLPHAPRAATLAALYLGVVPSAIGYVCWAFALARSSAARAASFLYLVPVLSFGIGFVWLGEEPTGLALAGCAVAIAGVALANSGDKVRAASRTRQSAACCTQPQAVR
jgi:drug/metabolite transporter (DMT)-like permease